MNKKIIYLSKGGLIIDTNRGAVQLGVPPETIKDSLALERHVPEIYVATKNLFSHKQMLSFFDIEFPVYYNFFINNKKIYVFCTKEQKEIINVILKESFFGPEHLNIEMDYVDGKNNSIYPEMKKEMDFFARHPKENRQIEMSDIIEYRILENNKKIYLDNLSVKVDFSTNSVTIDDGEKIELNWDIDFPDANHTKNSLNLFLPPQFGITTLGSSHGFDPRGKTSGFIFWFYGTGVLIDPPVDSALWLQEENVDPRMINSVILTHCHSDHDAGLIQKILQEGRVTLYTTSTIFSSFVKKVSVLTGIPEISVIDIIDFVPVIIGKPININGAMVTFSYRLHSIPTIGFEVFFKGKTVVYTSDHLNDRSYFERLYAEKILTVGRYSELTNFNWNKDIIIHEAGIPPIHTSLDVLLDLPQEIKSHIYLVHTEKERIPENSGLTVSPAGLSNTMVIDIPVTVHCEAIQVLNLISGIDFFEDLKFEKASTFLSIIKYKKFKIGECLIKESEYGNRFFIIVAGRARVITNGIEKAVLASGSYFGETSIILNQLTTSTVIAITDIVAIVLEKEDFLSFITNTPIFERLKKLSDVRSHGSWSTIESNSYFNKMSIIQKNYFESLFEFEKVKDEIEIIPSQKPLEIAVLWNEGIGVIKDSNNCIVKELKKGDFIGSPYYLLGEKIPEKSVFAGKDSSYFKIKWNYMLGFYQKNPKILLELRNYEDFI